MKIEVRDNQAFFEIKPGEKVYVSFGSIEVEIGTAPDIVSGEMALSVVMPGGYVRNCINLGQGEHETQFVVIGKAALNGGEPPIELAVKRVTREGHDETCCKER